MRWLAYMVLQSVVCGYKCLLAMFRWLKVQCDLQKTIDMHVCYRLQILVAYVVDTMSLDAQIWTIQYVSKVCWRLFARNSIMFVISW